MKKNSWGLICSIVGGAVIAAAAIVALVHFWDDLKALLPCCKCGDDEDEVFADLDE